MGFLRYLNPGLAARRLVRDAYLRRFPGSPLLAIGAIDFLREWIKPTDNLLEYGSGHSTRWYADRCGKLISVENVEGWAEIVRRETADCTNVDLRLFPANEIGSGGDGGYGAHTDRPFEGPQVSADYVHFAQELEESSFDLIVNDGWARHQVGIRALRLVRPGGAILWDDVDWNELVRSPTNEVQRFVQATAAWRRATFDDGIHRTLIVFACS